METRTEPLIPNVPATRQKAAIPGRSRRNAVTGKLKTALDAMVWEGLKRNDAATAAGLAESSLRFALRKPHVLAYFRAETAALRENLRARNLHRLDGIADDSKNDQARVKAIQVIEQIADVADQHQRPGETQSPGVVIVIQQSAAVPPPAAGPMITIDQPGATILQP